MDFLNVLSDWQLGGTAAIILGAITFLLKRKGFSLKRFLNTSSKITKEMGEALLATSDWASSLNNAIKEDGSIDQDSLEQAIAEGKEMKIEWKDVSMIVKPKKKK